MLILFTGVCYSGSENMSICHMEWQGAEWRGIFSLHLCELQSPLPPKVSLGGEAGRIGVHAAVGPDTHSCSCFILVRVMIPERK